MSRYDQSWTLFLDRDGVLNRRITDGYVTNWDKFELLPGVLDALIQVRPVFGRIVIVTNQRGISRGLFTEAQLNDIHNRLEALLAQNSCPVDGIYVAPGPNDDPMRKPNIGMALKARLDFPEIDFTKSIMVGDSSSDIAFGRNIGAECVFITTDKQECEPKADLYHASLWEWAKSVLETVGDL